MLLMGLERLRLKMPHVGFQFNGMEQSDPQMQQSLPPQKPNTNQRLLNVSTTTSRSHTIVFFISTKPTLVFVCMSLSSFLRHSSMSILTQNKFFFSANEPRPAAPWLQVRGNGCVRCLAATTTTGPTQGSKLQPGKISLIPEPTPSSKTPVFPQVATSPAPVMPEDPSSLKSTWSHRAWLICGCTTVFVSLAKSALIAAESHSWAGPILAGWVGYVLADLGSGVYHWGIDNYGDAKTPIFGSQIEAFQGHHKWPWTITRREFANNIHALARVITFSVLPVDLLCNDPTTLGFVALFSGCIMFSQQFHSWAHGTKSKLPAAVVALQDAGIIVSRAQHAAHHRPPYNNNYCIVSGVWNQFLDETKVFEALEMALYFKLGLRPRSWDEPSSEWLEDIESSAGIEAS